VCFVTASLSNSTSSSSIWVTEVPTYVRPYAIAHYLAGGCVIGAQVYRFPVTSPSSGYAFSLISTNAPGSGSLGVLPHIHEVHYENFFNFRGRFQLWTDKYDDENTRVLGPGDYGAVPHNTTHTFQILDPDTEMVGVIQPGGFEWVLSENILNKEKIANTDMTISEIYSTRYQARTTLLQHYPPTTPARTTLLPPPQHPSSPPSKASTSTPSSTTAPAETP